jgi:hypothetical protein
MIFASQSMTAAVEGSGYRGYASENYFLMDFDADSNR